MNFPLKHQNVPRGDAPRAINSYRGGTRARSRNVRRYLKISWRLAGGWTWGAARAVFAQFSVFPAARLHLQCKQSSSQPSSTNKLKPHLRLSPQTPDSRGKKKIRFRGEEARKVKSKKGGRPAERARCITRAALSGLKGPGVPWLVMRAKGKGDAASAGPTDQGGEGGWRTAKSTGGGGRAAQDISGPKSAAWTRRIGGMKAGHFKEVNGSDGGF